MPRTKPARRRPTKRAVREAKKLKISSTCTRASTFGSLFSVNTQTCERLSSEKVKRTLLIGLGVVFVGLLVYQLFLKGPAPRSKLTAQPNAPSAAAPPAASAPANPQTRQVGAAAQQELQIQQLLSDMTP